MSALCTIALSLVFPASAFAQRTASITDGASQPVAEWFSRPVTVTVDRASLRDALLAIGQAAHVRLLFQKELLDAVKTPVTVRATERPLGDVFKMALSETPLRAVPVGPDVVSIEPIEPGHAHNGVGTGTLTGILTGIVTDSTTGQAVAGATITIVGAKRRRC
jgi:hypothetical protein